LRVPSDAQLGHALAVHVLPDLASLIASYGQESLPDLLRRHFEHACDDFLSITECIGALKLINGAPLVQDMVITVAPSTLDTVDLLLVLVRDGSQVLKPDNEAGLLDVFLPFLQRMLDGLPPIDKWPFPMRNDVRCTSQYDSVRSGTATVENVLRMLDVALLLENVLDDVVDHRCTGWMHATFEFRGLSSGIIQNPIGRSTERLTRVWSARLNSPTQNARLQDYWQPLVPLRRKFELAQDINAYNESKECMVAAVLGVAVGASIARICDWFG
jgi:hypothetical protein